MGARNIILPFITSVLTLSLLVFVSCAHQSPSEEQGLESAEAGPADLEATSEETASGEAAADAAPTSDEGVQQAPPDDMVASNESPTEASTAEKPADGVAEATKTAPGGDAIVEDGTQNAAPGTGDEMLSEIENPAAPVATTPPVESETAATPLTPTESPVSEPVVASPTRSPRIPKMAFSKKGTLLNRFYFLRAGDTPDAVGKLLLGSGAKVAALQQWNPGKWKPGKILFYASVTDSADKRMQSLYQERSIASEPYTVGRGDWLSKIAAKHYGSPMSWKEIATLNGIRNPDAIERGQQISLMPRDLSGYSGASQFTQKTEVPLEPPPTQVAQGPLSVPDRVESPQPPLAEPPSAESPPDVPPPDVNGKKEHSFDLAGLVEQNLVFIATGAAIILLLVALIAIKKKKGRVAAEDFGDDPVAPPKARRS